MYNDVLLEASGMAAIMSMLASFWFIGVALTVLEIVAMWKLYSKAGVPGWGSLIPFYNNYLMYKITWGNGWLFLLMFVPIVNIVIAIMTLVKLSKSFGQGGGFAVGLIFLNFIFMLILAFGNYQYIGPDGIAAQNPQAPQNAPVQ